LERVTGSEFPSLKRRGGCAVSADGVVIYAKSLRTDHPGASRHPSFSRRGVLHSSRLYVQSPSLKRRGVCAVSADGVVIDAKSGGIDHPGASRHPSFSRRGILHCCGFYVQSLPGAFTQTSRKSDIGVTSGRQNPSRCLDPFPASMEDIWVS
jgi:hypothetical protein